MVAPDSIIPRATPDSENRTDTQTIQGVGGCRLHPPTPWMVCLASRETAPAGPNGDIPEPSAQASRNSAGSHAVARCRPMNCKAAIQAFRASSIETHPLGPRRCDFCVEKTPCVWSSYHSCPFTNMRAERDSEGEGERERERESDKGKKIEQT